MGEFPCSYWILSQPRSIATRPVRQGSIDEATRLRLERRISERPEKSELVDRNILKGKQHRLTVLRNTSVYQARRV